jgi:cysteine desulfurase / selenocysteine lyase
MREMNVLDNELLMRFAPVRSDFPGAERGPYLDVAARALLYARGRAAVDAYLDRSVAGTIDKQALFEKVEQVRSDIASLMRCEPDEIAFTSNVTDGLARFGSSLPWTPGDNVIICEELEHPANIYPWHGLRNRFGVETKRIPSLNGHAPLQVILDCIDERTKVVTVASVSFAPGFRFPVRDLGIECRRRGVLLVVDAAQSIGVVETDVRAWNADAVAASTQKGLFALYGLGILYVRKDVAERMQPTALSRFGVELSDAHEATTGDPRASSLGAAARRFEIGNYNYAGVIAAGESVKLLLGLGPVTVERYVLGLARHFALQVTALDLSVYGGIGEHNSHIVTVGSSLGDDHDATADRDTASLYEFLKASGVRLSIRRNLLRFSFHLYNNIQDIEYVVGLIREWQKRAPALGASQMA